MNLALTRPNLAFLDFVEGLRTYAVSGMSAPIKQLWDSESEKFAANQGHRPANLAEAAEVMDGLPTVHYRDFLKRRAQELMWEGSHQALKAREEELRQRLNAFVERTEYGRAELHPDLEIPEWFKRVNFHIQPGAYWGDDMTSFVYDLAAKIYHLGTGQERRVAYMVANALPRRDYKRILDLGSGVAKSTIPLKKTFPEAEVFGVDMSAPMVKYGHMIAEEEGVAITFSQQNAEQLSYADGSFDLVQAFILFHELPLKSLERVSAEAYRVLQPGGHFVVADLPPWSKTPLMEQWISSWEVQNNGEPFWKSTLTTDLPALLRKVGFATVSEHSPNPNAGNSFPANVMFPWMTLAEKAS